MAQDEDLTEEVTARVVTKLREVNDQVVVTVVNVELVGAHSDTNPQINAQTPGVFCL